jgi:hypothetical protein
MELVVDRAFRWGRSTRSLGADERVAHAEDVASVIIGTL